MARRQLSRGHGARRLTEWGAFSFPTDFATLAASTGTIVGGFVAEDPETVVRCRGSLVVQSDQISASERAFGAWGICVVSDQAFAAGFAALPNPVSNPDSDLWLAYGEWFCPVTFSSAVGYTPIDKQYIIDSKAMRKVNPDQTLAVIMANASSAFGIRFVLNLRVLTKLA